MKIILFGALIIASFSAVWTASISSRANDKMMVCYFSNWAVYRPGNGKFDVENVDPFLCTHAIYSFTGLSLQNKIQSLDAWNDFYDNWGKGAMQRFTGLKKINPNLKTLVAIGGWNEGSEKYSRMAADPAKRAIFVQSVVDFLGTYGFDGLDLDWEYPATRGGMPSDKQNFVALVRELKTAFAPRGWLLTAAVSAGKYTIDLAYDIPAMAQYFDILNLMSYDYHGGNWETTTGINSPLYANLQFDKGDNIYLNVNWSVNHWISSGFPASKIALGMPLYAQGWTLANPADNGVYATAYTGITPGPYTQQTGIWGYNELCEKLTKDPIGWTVVRDSLYSAPYMYRGNQWLSYDDRQSLLLKTQYAMNKGLGGSMVWSIETDDFRGLCGGGQFPMINAIREGMGLPVVVPGNYTTSTTTTTAPTSTTTSTVKPNTTTTKSTTTSTVRPNITTTTATTTTTSTTTTRPANVATTTTTATVSTISQTTPKTNGTLVDPATHCKGEGLNADPNDCGWFYNCVINSSGGYTAYRQQCAPGTVFTEIILACTYPENVPGCENYYNSAKQ